MKMVSYRVEHDEWRTERNRPEIPPFSWPVNAAIHTFEVWKAVPHRRIDSNLPINYLSRCKEDFPPTLQRQLQQQISRVPEQ